MTDKTAPDEARRDELRAKIDAAEARNEQRSLGDYAKEAQETATTFVKEHPLAAIGGVAVIGLIIGALTPPGRRAVGRAGSKASGLAAMAAELGIAYGSGLMDAAGDTARHGREAMGDVSDGIGRKARGLRRSAAHSAGDTGDDLRMLTRKVGRRASRSARDLKARIR